MDIIKQSPQNIKLFVNSDIFYAFPDIVLSNYGIRIFLYKNFKQFLH